MPLKTELKVRDAEGKQYAKASSNLSADSSSQVEAFVSIKTAAFKQSATG